MTSTYEMPEESPQEQETAPLPEPNGRDATTDAADDPPLAEGVSDHNRWLATVLASINDGVIATGPDGRIRLINPVAGALTDWKEGEAIGRSLEDVFRIRDEVTGEPRESPVTTVLREGKVVGIANHAVLVSRNGTERPIDDTGAPILGDDGSILGVVLCFRDVIPRRQAETARARLADIVESSNDAIIGEDCDGTIISWNEAAHQIFGYTAEEAIGRSIMMLAPPDLPDEIPGLIAAVRRAERVEHFRTHRVHKDGSIIDVSVTLSPICDALNRVVGVSKIARDISREKRVEEVLRASEVRLKDLTRRLMSVQEDERRRLSRELHDEIGQTLAAVKINLQLSVMHPEAAAPRLEESMSIVEELFQRVHSLALDLRPSMLDNLGLVAALRWYVDRYSQRTGLAGHLRLDSEKIHVDPEIGTVCFRVLQEALTNIARHARASRYDVELLKNSCGLELVIRDDGCGFEPSRALRAASRGANLGLTGMIERVESVGGTIEIISAPGKGTEIQVSFPSAMPTLPAAGVIAQ